MIKSLQPPSPAQAALTLASSSRYRAELLRRLHLDFTAEAADIDETPWPEEPVEELVQRLADGKAAVLAKRHPQAWIIGSDQAAALDGRALGKPGTADAARTQLANCAGRAVQFFTAVTVQRGDAFYRAVDVTTVRFRALTAEQIGRYVEIEPALDCAGSFKCEGYGITLFEAIETQDPTALVGLPLIATARLLRTAGFPLP
ncbi:Maf family protein [Solimonas marina]|uniref:7-methyl-GTP pyrophosphatase n=1 Tax=Solimonas marina TaxID=2714601 RepID=A0A969W862_9GAMM|nr:Maf family protein [Solimonas marina]NKF22481.1 septum formation protein Maf [Solimonas marina]